MDIRVVRGNWKVGKDKDKNIEKRVRKMNKIVDECLKY